MIKNDTIHCIREQNCINRVKSVIWNSCAINAHAQQHAKIHQVPGEIAHDSDGRVPVKVLSGSRASQDLQRITLPEEASVTQPLRCQLENPFFGTNILELLHLSWRLIATLSRCVPCVRARRCLCMPGDVSVL